MMWDKFDEACPPDDFAALLEPLEGLAAGPAVEPDGQAPVRALAYAGERWAFGKPIGSFEALQFKIADMKVAVETARLATYKAAWLRDRGRPFATEASVAKLYASEVAATCAREAVQVHGAYGYIEEFPVARFYRDAKVLEIGEGTNEIQRLLIARALGLPGTEL